MAEHFDGAGRRFTGPSYKGPILSAIASLVTIALTWLAYSYALNVMDGNAELPSWPAGEVELAVLAIGALAGLALHGRLAAAAILLASAAGTAVVIAGTPAPVDPWFVVWITTVCAVISLASFGIARALAGVVRGRVRGDRGRSA